MHSATDDVAGVDGCRGGWVVAHAAGIDVVSSLAPLLERFAVIGVDMPIGLPDGPHRGADSQARRFLGRRHVTVFTVPSRTVLAHTSHRDANAASRHLYGRGVTVQSFNLFPKIREVDALPVELLRDRIVEIHPECAFVRMAGAPLPPKRTAEGAAARRALVREHVGLDVTATRGSRAAAHDVLDACAVLWSARRYVAGVAIAFGDGALDARGVPMRIVS